MQVVVCALAKNEHLYINEWVQHYFKLGFDKIYLFDNDDKDSPYIKDYIDKKYLDSIKIINARGTNREGMQHDFYTNFYKYEKDNFDWCLFCDIDEFLTGIDNIKDFLKDKRFLPYQQIRIKWKLFGDDNLIERDMSKPLLESFYNVITSSLTNDLKRKNNLERQAKTIVRGHLPFVHFNSVHYACDSRVRRLLPSCLPSGKKTYSLVAIEESYENENIFLNHYMTKTLSEFVNQKMNRTDAVFGDRLLKLNYYWRINEKTPEKIEYLKNMGLDI